MEKTITIDPFDSKTGKGTLSFYAREYGTSVKELAKANNINNPNVIQAGGSLVVPDNNLQRSTTALRNETEKNMSKYDEQTTATRDAAGTGSGQGTDPNANPPATTNKDNQGVYDPFEGLDDQQRDIRESSERQINDLMSTYDSITKFADRAHRDLIDATKKIYGARITNMEDANKRLLATKGVANDRDGVTRYANEFASGILTDEELSGQERLIAIEAEMLKAIAEADQAKVDNDFTRFNSAFDKVQQVKSAMEKQVQDSYDNAVARDKAIRDERKAQRDAQKQELDMSMDRASVAAPAIADQLNSYETDEERMEFLQAYSKQTGVDIDILMGEVTKAAQDKDYKDLQSENLRNTIKNRDSSNARQWAAENRAAAKAAKDESEEEEDDVDPITKNVIQGAQTIDELNGAERSKVTTDLRELGYYTETPPGWFIEMTNQTTRSSVPTAAMSERWEEHRQGIIGGGL